MQRHWVWGATIAPLQNLLQQKKKVETNLSDAILNSGNNNDINDSTSHNNSKSNNNKITIKIKLQNMKHNKQQILLIKYGGMYLTM